MKMTMDDWMRGGDRFVSLTNMTLTSCGCKRLLFYLNSPILMISVDFIPIIPNEKVVYRIFGPLTILYRARANCALTSSLFHRPRYPHPHRIHIEKRCSWTPKEQEMFLNVNNNYCSSWQKDSQNKHSQWFNGHII